MSKSFVLTNRHKDKITFTKHKTYVLMEGAKYFRCGFEGNKIEDMIWVDPSGGPFISKGNTLDFINEKWKNIVITGFEFLKNPEHETVKIYIKKKNDE
jgi:hypothetical protein